MDDLARMVQGGFAETNSKIETLGSKIESLEKKVSDQGHAIEAIDLHLSAYASRRSEDFERLHDWVKEIDERLSFVENKTRK